MDCGRPRQVSELWAALVRTTGLSNLPPWRACERTGQHLGRGEVTKQGDQSGSFEGLYDRPGAPVSRRSPRSRAHRGPRAGFFGVGRACRPGPADRGQRRTRAGGCRAGELVDQGQQIEVSAGHEPEDVAPVSSSPRTSDPQPVTPDGTISNRVSSSTRASVGRDTAPGISLLMEWWTIHHRAAKQSLARDARRSHRSVEDDVSPPREREREETPILYKRV